MLNLADRPTTTDPVALERVRRFIEAENRRDLVQVRALLHGECMWRVNGRLAAVGGRDIALGMVHDWDHAPDPVVEIEDLGIVGDMVTVRYRLFDAAEPGTGRRVGVQHGYTVFEVQDGLLIRIWQYVDVLDPAPASPPPAEPPAPPVQLSRPRRRVRRALTWLAVGATIVANELVITAPVVAAAAHFGPWKATVALVPLYFAGGLVGSWAVYRLYDRQLGAGAGVLERRTDRLAGSPHGRAALRLLRRARVTGYLVAAVLVGGPPITWALRSLGVRRSVSMLAVGASAIWAVTFVALYAGLVSLAW